MFEFHCDDELNFIIGDGDAELEFVDSESHDYQSGDFALEMLAENVSKDHPSPVTGPCELACLEADAEIDAETVGVGVDPLKATFAVDSNEMIEFDYELDPISQGEKLSAYESIVPWTSGHYTNFSKQDSISGQARLNRRLLMNTKQVIKLHGGREKVEEDAISDSYYAVHHLQAILMQNTFAENFVVATWEQVHLALIETAQRRFEYSPLSIVGDKPSILASSDSLSSLQASTNTMAARVRQKSLISIGRNSEDLNATTIAPNEKLLDESCKEEKRCRSKYSNNTELPEGNDPESQKQRRLIRNRISAQRSRDKFRMEMEEAKQQKTEKQKEVDQLKILIAQEKLRITKLEKLIRFVECPRA